MMNVPNMISEVIESIDYMFSDIPEVGVDCLLFLQSLKNNPKMVNSLSERATAELVERNRCTRCGEKLHTYQYNEVHNELDDNPVEVMYDMACPNCDMVRSDMKEVEDE